MGDAPGAADRGALRLDFNRRRDLGHGAMHDRIDENGAEQGSFELSRRHCQVEVF